MSELSADEVLEKFLARADLTEKDDFSNLKDVNFNFWRCTKPYILLQYFEDMLVSLDILTFLDIDITVVRNFLCEIYRNYNWNHYHNFNHCFCVTQMMFCLIQNAPWASKEDKIILILSAICHDLGHPGTNNNFQVVTNSNFVRRYSEKSTLEQYHAHLAREILAKTHLLKNLDKGIGNRLLDNIQVLILATDMGRHGEILEEFRKIIDNFNNEDENHKQLVMMVMLKACDISNEGRPFQITELWVSCLLEEFFDQGDQEKKLGVTVTPQMDRERVEKNKSQCFFLKTFSIPLFETLNKIVSVEPMLVNMRNNLAVYEDNLKQQSQE